jgi:glucose-6-phosphate 1-dehydrogenase
MRSGGVFAANLHYCVGDLTDAAAYEKLEQRLSSFNAAPLRQNLLFYLATQPSQFGDVIERLHAAQLLQHGQPRRLAADRRREAVRPRPEPRRACSMTN